MDINIHQENLFHTKMLLRDFNLQNYLFASAYDDFSAEERDRIKESLSREMTEIFYSKNIY
jgi:S-adenosylmethionine decarboxylase